MKVGFRTLVFTVWRNVFHNLKTLERFVNGSSKLLNKSSRVSLISSRNQGVMSLSSEQPRSSSDVAPPTAGIIVIGDEILKGQTLDTNSHFICRRLFSLGVRVHRVSVIGDNVDAISSEVAKFSSLYTYVITSGGVGPTHDDLTHMGIAKAFNEEIVSHPQIVEMCQKFFRTDQLTQPQLKLCQVAKSSILHRLTNPKSGETNKFPVITVNNVFVFPGVPKLLENSFLSAEHMFRSSSVKFHTNELFVNVDEIEVAAMMDELSEKYRDQVFLGSYPNFQNSYYKVKVSLESETADHLTNACSDLTRSLPPGSLVTYDSDPMACAADRVYGLLDPQATNCVSEEDATFTKNVREAVEALEESLSRYTLDQLCLCFNGGKDCTAMLHLLYAVIKRKYPEYNAEIQTLYIRSQLPFPDVEKFIQKSRNRYGLNLICLDGRIKECLTSFKSLKPEISAIVMGTRCTDPRSGNLKAFSQTDPDWPQYMRINPLIHWRYHDVWRFLRTLCLPYCMLYDKGYTSLGSMNNTYPNPYLQYINDRGIVCYLPAHKLSQDNMERDGRKGSLS